MTTCKVDWSIYSKEFIEKFINANPKINLQNVLMDAETKTFLVDTKGYLRPIGCEFCIDGNIWQNDLGDFVIDNSPLINYRNFAIENDFKVGNELAEELSNNIWICPHCKRFIFDFMPNYDNLSFRGE